MNKERKNVSLAYLKARKIFREYADQDPGLQFNEKILGRIGEAIAHSFLEHLGRKPIVNINQTNPGYDITCQDNGEQVSVKMITNENKSGSTSKIRKSFNIFMGIELSQDFKIKRLVLFLKRVLININQN